MPNQFYKGRTNNHLTWVMVDATDFATPESAASAATTIKIYGKLRGAAGVNFVSSGTGSLTNDITHVGASATGIYSIGLVKADLSDASAAWYDQYIIALSCTGCARQTLVVDGGIDQSEMLSQTLLILSAASDAASAAAQANSRVLLVQSRLSDFDSRMVSDVSDIRSMLSDMLSDFQSRVPKLVATSSQLSDLSSDMVSDLKSFIGAGVPLDASTMSDIRSAVAAITVTLDASAISDIASAVVAGLPVTSAISDIYSMLSDFYSDFQSRVPKLVATNSQVLLTQSLASDAASAAAQGNSRILLVQSRLSDFDSRMVSDVSDIRSLLSDFLSDFQSRVPKAVATNSQLLLTQSLASDAASAAQQANSRVLVTQSMASDAASAAQVASSRVTLMASNVSDIYSLLSDVSSDLGVLSGVVSDVYSNLAAGVNVGASDMSDLRSAITANGVLRAGADPTTVVGVTGTLAAKVDWLAALARNKVTQTATVQSLRNDGDSADVASAAVSDDGVTFTRSEWA